MSAWHRQGPGPRQGAAAQGGFTLLELLVATAVLGVAIVALLGLQARNLAITSEAAEITIATTLAGDVMAMARLDPLLAQGSSAGGFVPTQREEVPGRDVYGGSASEPYAWTRDVMPTALPGLLQVRVQVRRRGSDRVLCELWSAASPPGSQP